jgi:hypothetical protein
MPRGKKNLKYKFESIYRQLNLKAIIKYFA